MPSFADNTFLVVTHRVSTLKQSDRILLMDQGIILEDGKWNDLMDRSGAFFTLATQQGAHNG